jgi:hypothetical protein
MRIFTEESMAEMTVAERNAFAKLLTEAVREASERRREARGAWLKQRLMRVVPDFDQRRHGYATFREFVGSFGELAVEHDGVDLLVRLREDSRSTLAMSAFEASRPPDDLPGPGFVARPLWDAFIRDGTAVPAYLDRQSLDGREVSVEFASPSATHDFADESRWIYVPPTTEEENKQVLLRWLQSSSVASAPDVLAVRELLGNGRVTDAVNLVQRDPSRRREFVRLRAQATNDRVRKWLREHGLRWAPPIVEPPRSPSPLLSVAAASPAHRASPDRVDLPTRSSQEPGALRDIVHAVIDRMNEDDLRALRLPVGMVLDALRR